MTENQGLFPIDPARPEPVEPQAYHERVSNSSLHDAAARVEQTIIKASAGSGKTFRLSSRFIILLALGATSESILATTFTRKAAGEILERILRRLAAAAKDEAGARELADRLTEDLGTRVDLPLAFVRELLRRVTNSLHRVAVSTLDSYFSRIAGAFRLELDLPAKAEIVDDRSRQAADLRRAAVAALLEKGSVGENVELLLSLEQENAGAMVGESLDRVLSELRDLYLDSPPEAWSAPVVGGRELDEAGLKRVRQRFEDALEEKLGKNLLASCRAAIDAIKAGNWVACCNFGPLKKIVAGADEYQRKPLSDPVFDPFHELKDHVAAVRARVLARQTSATFELLARFQAEFARLARRHRILFFSDLPRVVAGGLDPASGRLGDVGYRLDGMVRHLLLDEFQDTNPDQWRVLRPIAAEIISEGRPAESGRSFFCVGDMKQAIYGWRGGCARIFDAIAEELHLGAANIRTLDESRRSAQVVLDVVYRIYQSFDANVALENFPGEARRWKAEFPRHTAFDKSLSGYVELATSPEAGIAGTSGDGNGDEEVESAGSAHDNFVADRIESLGRERPDASIGVLVRTNAAAQGYLSRLRRRGVPASGESGNPLDVEPAVTVILSALILADHPGDTAAAYHLLKSPLAGAVGIESLDAGHVASVSSAIRARIVAEGLAGVVASWAAEIAPHCDAQAGSVFRLERLIEMAEGFRSRDPLRPSEFVKHVRETAVDEPIPARVRVMTIHKSKGLEFDIVVLPELQKKIGQFDGAVCVTRDDPMAPPTRIVRSGNSRDRALIPALAAAHAAECGRRVEDDLAGLYVAMTRARHALHMIVPPLKVNKDGEFAARGHHDSSFATLLRAALSEKGDDESEVGGETLFAAGDPGWMSKGVALNEPARPEPVEPQAHHERDLESSQGAETSAFDPMLIRLAPVAEPGRRGLRRVAPSSLSGGGRVSVESLLGGARSPASDRGSLFHKWFEQIAWIDGGEGVPPDVELLDTASRVFPVLAPGFVKECLADFRACLAKPQVVDIFARPSGPEPELWRERPFVVPDSARLIVGQFDRVVIVRENGRPVSATLIDFKTDRVPDAAALAAARELYTPQIAEYRSALVKILGLAEDAIQTRLLFV
jgi:ATP-dependent exoDNAse (exonuclease V) beta subunit